MRVASSVADGIQRRFPGIEIWLEGALAEGLAHGHSDVDLRVITASPIEVGPKAIDGIRIDIHTSHPAEIQELTCLLGRYDADLTDPTSFRAVREKLPTLTLLRTAQRWTAARWSPVLTGEPVLVYRLWALADRVELLLSLTEDLAGLVADGLIDSAEVVVDQMSRALMGAEAVAAGRPLVGDKWLPCLAPERPLLGDAAEAATWFPLVRRQVAHALTSVHGDREPIGDVSISAIPPGPWWLPQRYADGWYARFGDLSEPISPAQARQWWAAPIGEQID